MSTPTSGDHSDQHPTGPIPGTGSSAAENPPPAPQYAPPVGQQQRWDQHNPQQPYGNPGYGPPPAYGPGHPGTGNWGPQQPANVLAIVGLVLGIIGLVLFWTVFGGILLGIGSLVTAGLGLARANRERGNGKGLAIGGLVTGGLALLLSLGMLFVLGAAVNSVENGVGSYNECITDATSADDYAQCDTEFYDNNTFD